MTTSHSEANRIYVGNLSWGTTANTLRKAFDACGWVVDAVVVVDAESGRSKGFGFVSFRNSREAAGAVDRMNGTRIDGRVVSVTLARPKRRRNEKPYAGQAVRGPKSLPAPLDAEQTAPNRTFVRIVRGGTPGLGKRSR